MPQPVMIATWSFGQRGNDAAWPALAAGGSSIDAVEAASCIIEADEEVDSVGYGGLPDRTGRVSLDGCIMLSPRRAGSIAGLRKHLHPVSIARKVMEQTRHIMIVGEEADRFASEHGFEQAELLSPSALEAWEKWKQDPKTLDQSRDKAAEHEIVIPRPIDDGAGGIFRASEAQWKHHDTVGILALDREGVLAGACSTSGTPYKRPGRVGDSPIIGHGLYVDPQYGGATATGTGELIMGVCGSFTVVEHMRRGASPLEALSEVLQRIADGGELRPEHQVAMIALSPSGEYASAALRSGYLSSVRTSESSHVVEPDLVLLAP